MCSPKAKDLVKAKFKVRPITLILIFLMVVIVIKRIKCDICEEITVDAITQLHNGSIVVFSEKNLWFLDPKLEELSGPCAINSVFKNMTGPIDAAITISYHETITDFVGAGIYFQHPNFFTFKNFGQYQVEWGAIIYLPVKGLQKIMGRSDPDAQKYMERTMSYAFFDPKDQLSKFVFDDGTTFSFTFEMGAEYDIPTKTEIDQELAKYKISRVPKTLTAALTLAKDNTSQLYLFEGKTYCSVTLSKKGPQECRQKPIKDFFKCSTIQRKNGFCLNPKDVVTQSYEKPVESSDKSRKSEDSGSAQNPVTEQVKSRMQSDTKDEVKDRNSATGLISSLFPMVFTLLSIYI